MMTRRQRTALERPCLLAEETMHQRYFSQTRLATIVLTVNTGYE